nr:putative RdRP [Vo narna-like virus]
MHRQDRWAPTLPSFGGRLAPRIALPEGYPSDYNSKLELYYLERQSCLSIFVHKVDNQSIKKFLGREWSSYYHKIGQSPRIEELPGDVLYKYLLAGLGHITMSANFQRKLSALCNAKDLTTIKRWWQTTDGIVYPLLLSVEDPDACYTDIDRLIKFSMENCANNYAQFTSRMKSLKRLLRKDYAEMTSRSKSLTDVATYREVFEKYMPTDEADPHRMVQYILCWAQTRASGLADSKMISKSLDKCEATLSTQRRESKLGTPEFREYTHRGLPTGEPELPKDILDSVSWRVSRKVRGEVAHISAGPNACLESTRKSGGQTGLVKALARRQDALHKKYNFCTLEAEEIPPQPVNSQETLLSWAIQETLEHPTYVKCVRLHAVAEPSKARTITVCSLPYLVIVGVIAKLLQPAIASDITRGGLHASRNLWNFLFNDLDPNLGVWAKLRDEVPTDKPILGLSSDLSEATDYGDIGVARQLLSNLLDKCSSIPGFPIGLANLAKSLFIGKRFCFRYDSNGRTRFFVKRNGWLMGDRITKVILTLAHEIVVISSGLHCARICGDDVIAFSRNRERLEKYLTEVERLGFKVSWEDSYISSRLAFYCEEGCIPPQRFRELPAVCSRRKHQSMYIDYPRIRLLIPTCIETRAYSFTDTGRFALLGKEMRWVQQNGLDSVVPLFHRATLLQHLNVPQPGDTMCPFLPIELGGDGAFPTSHTFLKDVVFSKSRDFRETCFRMKQLLTSKWGFRFVRSPNLNDVVHKYHVLLPKLRETRELIRKYAGEDAIVEGNELLLGSIKCGGLESPERSFFRIWRAWYWHHIFQTGREPPKLVLGTERRFDRPDSDVNLDDEHFLQFFSHWRDTGFTFRDNPEYMVDMRHVNILDYMNMGWNFGFPPTWQSKKPTLDDLGGRKLLNEENMETFIDHIKDGRPLSPIVGETLYKYVETDSYILSDISRRWPKEDAPRCVILVSGDKRLAVEISRIQRSRRPIGKPEDPPLVVMVSPDPYLFGMMSYFEDWVDKYFPPNEVETIVDFGAVNYHAYVTVSGVGVWYDSPTVWTSPLWGNPDSGVLIAELDESSAPYRELWSLTTQNPDQVRKRLTLLRASQRDIPP